MCYSVMCFGIIFCKDTQNFRHTKTKKNQFLRPCSENIQPRLRLSGNVKKPQIRPTSRAVPPQPRPISVIRAKLERR